MTHFNQSELEWSKPFRDESTYFISSHHQMFDTEITSEIYNRPTWKRWNFSTRIHLLSHYFAYMHVKYEIDSIDITENTSLWKSPSNDSLFLGISFQTLRAKIWVDTLRLTTHKINNIEIPESFYIKHKDITREESWKPEYLYRKVEQLVWSKPLGLVYFQTADSTEYYRSDIFFGINIDKSKHN